MAELVPAPFADLVHRLESEPAAQGSVFELPRRSWYFPRAGDPDLSVQFHGLRSGNPSGPAAGPHTQMAQNLLLSYLAGGRILELKTVQVKDRLDIPRPCIDMTNVGYNVEWSQELAVEDSLREYVAGSMLIQMARRSEAITGGRLDDVAGDWIFDLSVGYDLAGIRSAKVCAFLDGMRDARASIDTLRSAIPRRFGAFRDAEYLERLSNSITLSTFHGCPVNEIEAITEYLIGERDFDVIVKMNPPTLGREPLEHLLYDVLGYHDLAVNPTAYDSVATFEESVAMCTRLRSFASQRGRRVGFKFSNTLEVVNHRDFFTADNTVMYLSGQPLYVITMALTDLFRQAVGPHVPISYSAGIDKQNFHHAVACDFVPITISSDLLRPGGYGRLPGYLFALADEMKALGVDSIDDFIRARFGHEDEAVQRAARERADTESADANERAVVAHAGLLNTTEAARLAREDKRYVADRNRKIPKRIDSHLAVFDCITCDKCLPVCPNAANFKYPTPTTQFEYQDLGIDNGQATPTGDVRTFLIDKTLQIACYADFCNECGNCDTFCPEYGGPYIEKPSFFGTAESWRQAEPRDGFHVEATDDGPRIVGRIKGVEYSLVSEDGDTTYRFDDGVVGLKMTQNADAISSIEIQRAPSANHEVDMWAYHTLRYLLRGILDNSRINQVNAAWIDEPA